MRVESHVCGEREVQSDTLHASLPLDSPLPAPGKIKEDDCFGTEKKKKTTFLTCVPGLGKNDNYSPVCIDFTLVIIAI